MKAERLRKVPLFEGLTDHQYERLERWTDEIDVPTNKHLVNQGAYPHEFMVIESGTAEVTHDGTHLADLGPGDFFGEMALLLNVPRTATVAATSESRSSSCTSGTSGRWRRRSPRSPSA